MIKIENNLVTSVKVVKEAVFSSTVGSKKIIIFGVPVFTRKYDESIGDVKFIEDSEISNEIGFSKSVKKK